MTVPQNAIRVLVSVVIVSLLLVSPGICDDGKAKEGTDSKKPVASDETEAKPPKGGLRVGPRTQPVVVEPKTYQAGELAVKQITPGTTTRIEKTSPDQPDENDRQRLVITFQRPGDSVDLVIPGITRRPHQLMLSLIGSTAGGVVDVYVAPRLIHWRHMASHPTVVDTHVDGDSRAVEVPLGAAIPHGQDDRTLTIQLKLGRPLEGPEGPRMAVIVESVSVNPYELADERAIVERVLAEKGEVDLWTHDEQLLQRVTKIKDVPETEWILQKVRLGPSADPDCMIELLARSQSLKELDAERGSRKIGQREAVPLTPGWLQNLTALTTLTSLTVTVDDWTPEDWSALEQLSQLTSLRLAGRNTAGGSSMKSVAKLKCLNSLNIDAAHVTPEQMSFLIDHPRLDNLFVNGATNATVKPLAILKSLRSLTLGMPYAHSIVDRFSFSSQVTAKFLQPITELPLESFSLFNEAHNPRVPDEILKPLEQIPTLKHVYLYDSRFSSESVERLKARLPRTCQVNVPQPAKRP